MAPMISRWVDAEAAAFVDRYAAEWGEPLALRTYTSRLLGAEDSLVLHGGGNSSVKSTWRNILGEEVPALFVKASGVDLASVGPEGHPGLDLDYLLRLRAVDSMSDEVMLEEMRTHLLRADSAAPSIEALVHAFIPARYVDHTHADAVLALTNRPDGAALAAEVFGEAVIVLPYVTPGFALAKACLAALEERPDAVAMVWAHHGLVTWGETARESYELMIRLVARAEEHLDSVGADARRCAAAPAEAAPPSDDELAAARARLAEMAPLVRGLLAEPTGDPDDPHRRMVVVPLATAEVSAALALPDARERFVSPPLTGDHLIRTKPLPMWSEALSATATGASPDDEEVRACLAAEIAVYEEAYRAYLARHAAAMPAGVEPFDAKPRVILFAGVGALCAGPEIRDAVIARDITEHTLSVKCLVDDYQGLPEAELFAMEYRTLQHAKLRSKTNGAPLRGRVAVVTGAAGAIGSGICEGLLENGCLVAATDLPGDPLGGLVERLSEHFPGRVAGVPLDVTDPVSVAAAFSAVAGMWGGVDLVVPNAGLACVASLVDLDLERYRRLEQVNVEGTLLVLAEAARMFRRQGIGGDIVLVSTKNVFAPGAGFGAYSSTKAAAHQLARVAGLELACDDVRVNMVAPDAVFSGVGCRSGLWAEVGPDRMKSRGLNEAGLEDYYRDRNLLKARVTAEHVARAVLFFATRQTPTTGATIPVDGGLPDSTPR